MPSGTFSPLFGLCAGDPNLQMSMQVSKIKLWTLGLLDTTSGIVILWVKIGENCCARWKLLRKSQLLHCARFLEEELARRYRDATPAMLALLQERCESAAAQLMTAEAQLNAAEDVASLRRAGTGMWPRCLKMSFVWQFGSPLTSNIRCCCWRGPCLHWARRGIAQERQRTTGVTAEQGTAILFCK